MRHALLLAVLVFAASCQQTAVATYEQKNIPLTVEGPLFSGPNTTQAAFPMAELEAWLKTQGHTLADVQGLRLTGASVRVGADSLTFDNCTEMVLQVVSDKTPMQRVGVLNPVPKGAKQVQLTLSADKADLSNYVKTAPFLLLNDVNLTSDQDAGMTLLGDFTFDVTIKQ